MMLPCGTSAVVEFCGNCAEIRRGLAAGVRNRNQLELTFQYPLGRLLR
jgi:hypothetical protein